MRAFSHRNSTRTVPRRTATIIAAVALALAAAAVVWWTLRSPVFFEPHADQNVLLITIDTLRADALGAYGGRAATPNIDRLAAGGARFTFAHAHAVVTLPSHASILTGRLPYEHGIRDNSGYRLPAKSETLATRLKSAGYATGAFVGGFPLVKRFGLAAGFDAYDDQISEMRADAVFTMPERPANAVVTRTLQWIGQQQGRFLAWVHLFDPHAPYRPPEEFLARYRDRPYDGEVAWVDHALGPLFERLAALDRPTLVVLTSDHGESLGEHGEMTHGMFAYEPTLRVPFVVTRVGRAVRVSRGIVSDVPVSHVDIMPTILDLVSVSSTGQALGRSLRHVIREGNDDRSSYFESMTHNLVRGWAPLRGVLVGREKYIDQPIVELYDLATDFDERRNRASTEAERTRLLANVLESFNAAPPGRPGRESADVTARLRSLGYVSGSVAPKTVYTEADDLKNLVAVDRDLHEASELYQSGRIADAIARLRSVIARRPDTADAYITLAHAYWETGRPTEAIATLENALSQGAPDRDVRIRLALYLADSGGDAGKALGLLEGLPPDDVEVLNARGVAYGSAGRYHEAFASFEQILTLEPTNALARQNVASMVLARALNPSLSAGDRLKGLRNAEGHARRAIELDPALAKAHTTLGVVLARTERKAEAIDSWKRAVGLDGTEFDALYNLVIVLAQSGRDGEARAYAHQFVASAPPASDSSIRKERS
jgi:arylsulfatase A-like enzyme/cytochrome c-type biogenesis protein CcmH/NrfG